jgi:hypothetical protein
LNINDHELSKLRAMLESYKQQHGTISMGSPESINYCDCGNSCKGDCGASCGNYCGLTCTDTCQYQCDGNSSSCYYHQ